MPIFAILQALLPGIFSAIDKAVPDRAAADAAKANVQMQLLSGQSEELKAASSVVMAEIQGDSWLQRSWRPMLMYVIIALVFNNYLLAPYLSAMFGASLTLPLPDRLWDLMTIGVGGYVGGRSAEKLMNTYANKSELPAIELRSTKR